MKTLKVSWPPRQNPQRSAPRALIVLLLLVLAAFCQPLVAAPKTDAAILKNGDHITGEVKSLEYNQVKLSTDHWE